MILFFNTSVLVPVFVAERPHHGSSFKLLSQLAGGNAHRAAHSLVEIYSTLTRIPPPYRVSPAEAILFTNDVLARLNPLAMDPPEYVRALQDVATAGISGGAVYDFLIFRCALKIGADVLYTWNTKHFSQFGEAASKMLRAPDAVAT